MTWMSYLQACLFFGHVSSGCGTFAGLLAMQRTTHAGGLADQQWHEGTELMKWGGQERDGHTWVFVVMLGTSNS